MYCKKCNCRYESGKFCFKCGSPLVPDPAVEAPIERKGTAEKGNWNINDDETKIVVSKAVYQRKETPEPERREPEPLPQAEIQKTQKKGKRPRKKKWLIAAVLLIVLVSAAVISIKIFAGGKGKFGLYGKDAIILQSFRGDGRPSILLTDGTTVDLKDKDYAHYDISMNAKVIGLISKDGILYLLDKTGYEQVDENVKWVTVSDTGAGLAYLTMGENDEYGELYQYDTAKKQSVQIASDVINGTIAISPDGKSIAFLDDEGRCHLYINGKESEDTIRGAVPLAIADGGKYFYYAKNYNLYAMKKKSDAVKLGSLEGTLYFNQDYSQVIFVNDGKTYYCNKASKADEAVFSKGEAVPCFPAMTLYKGHVANDWEGDSLEYISVIGTKDLRNMAYQVNGGLYFLSKKMETERIASSYEQVQVSEDGKSLLYRKDDKLYRVSGLDKSPEEERVGEERVLFFAADENLSRIYYCNDDNELMYIKGNKEAKLIYDEEFSKKIFPFGDYLYFLGDYSESTRQGTLYASKNGGKKQKVSASDEASDIRQIFGALYFQEDDTVYSINGTKKKEVE